MSLATMTSLLAEFGAAVGIPDLKPDAELRCNMMFDDVAVSFQLGPDDESLYVYSLVGSVAEADRAVAYPALLRANYAFEGTAGSTFSVDPRSGSIVLIRAERLETLRLARLAGAGRRFRERGGAVGGAHPARRIPCGGRRARRR